MIISGNNHISTNKKLRITVGITDVNKTKHYILLDTFNIIGYTEYLNLSDEEIYNEAIKKGTRSRCIEFCHMIF